MRTTLLLILLACLTLAPTLARADDAAEKEREFRRRIDVAITKGCQWLASRQQPDGTWKSPYDDKYPGGATALCLLALLLSEHNVWSDEVVKALAYVEKQNYRQTYSAAIAMMAMEARHIPPDEFKAMREGKPIKKFIRKLTPGRKSFLERHVKMLLNGRMFDAWGYPKGPDFSSQWPGDLSNVQYAVLGFKSAARCGIKIEESDWLKTLKIVLKAQQKTGPKVRLVVDKTVDKKGYASVETKPAEARGWQYQWPVTVKRGNSTQTMKPGPDDKPSGSMTTAGISCLAIIHSEVYKSRKYRKRMKDVSRALNDGFAWLQENFSVEENPGGKKEWHYYYLYGLERAGVLAGRKWIGNHDWYREGAEFLLDRQNGGGSWSGDILQTSFALLFLKRSTTPVALTGLDK